MRSMGASLNILIASGLTSLFLALLFSIEQHRGSRYGEKVRAVFDRMLIGIRANIRGLAPEVNNHFFQELFFYLIHKVLSMFLALVRKLEHIVLHVVRFNRMQVVRLRQYGTHAATDMSTDQRSTMHTDGHFAQIAEHKKSIELTPKEKQKRKDASISGSGPF